jgi:chromosome segregation ATPase
MQEQEDRLSQLDGELRFMKENVSRLEDNIRDRDTEIASLSGKAIECAAEAEELLEQLSFSKRKQAHSGDVQKRGLEEAITREREAREQLKTARREKATSDITLGSSKERLHSLSEEMSRLRAQVHQLQKEGADKEVTIVHLNKQVTQDKEDINGLNIALDPKQQELKLVSFYYHGSASRFTHLLRLT